MAYRSDVKFVFAFPTQRARTAFIAEVTLDTADHDDPEVRTLPKDFDLAKYSDPDVARIHYEDVKWYDSYPSVKYMDRVQEMAEGHIGQWAYVYTRSQFV